MSTLHRLDLGAKEFLYALVQQTRGMPAMRYAGDTYVTTLDSSYATVRVLQVGYHHVQLCELRYDLLVCEWRQTTPLPS